LIGTRHLVIIIFLTKFILVGSCTKEVDYYSITIKNRYFETLINTTIGDFQFDTVMVNEMTPAIILQQGEYVFASHTASGLMLSAVIKIQGDKQNIALIVNDHGKLLAE